MTREAALRDWCARANLDPDDNGAPHVAAFYGGYDAHRAPAIVVGSSLREKLEAPGVVREILASSSRLVELLDESEWGLPTEVLDVRDELRRKLALLDEIRTGS